MRSEVQCNVHCKGGLPPGACLGCSEPFSFAVLTMASYLPQVQPSCSSEAKQRIYSLKGTEETPKNQELAALRPRNHVYDFLKRELRYNEGKKKSQRQWVTGEEAGARGCGPRCNPVSKKSLVRDQQPLVLL